METIKVIDLLNKIANGEDVPKKIRYDDHIFKYEVCYEDYCSCEKDEVFNTTDYLFRGLENDEGGISICLNNEVEIIEDAEEDKEIEKMGILYAGINSEIYEDFAMKINEIIDVVNKLSKKGE